MGFLRVSCVRDWRRVGVAILLFGGALACAPAVAAADYGPVARQETLWSIAKKLATEQGGTTAQMAWALYQANPQAFDGSAGRIRTGATLTIPEQSVVRATPTAQAHAQLNGTPAPKPAPATKSASARRAAGPVIAGVELQARVEGEPYQWLVVTGAGFAPGAVLEFRDAAGGALPAGKPQSVRPGRIEYAAAFPEQAARWQTVVRNADGRRSAPQEFDVGGPVADAAPVMTPAGAFEGSADQQALLEHVRNGASTEERYQLLAALDERYAGDVDFDYPLGTLALDTGRFSEAVFILQRAVARRPAFAGARMELARAYYALGDNESARREFTTLQQQDPPADAKRVIAQYLDAIDQRAVSYEAQSGVYAELATGYDSNANGAPDIQNFIGFNLDARNQSTASSYYALGVGGALSHPFAPAWRAVGSALGSYRVNPDASFVDSQVLRLGGGLEWRPRQWIVSLVPNATYAMLDGEENHQVIAADGAASYDFGSTQYAVSLRYAQQRYTEALAVQDIDTLLYGLSTQTRAAFLPRVQFSAAVTAGTDEPVQTGSQFGRDVFGVRAGALIDVGRGSALLVSLASVASDYDGRFFVGPRSDDQLSAALGFESGLWRDTGWRLRLQASYIDNASTIELYDYDRIDAGLSVRKEFK